MATYKEIKGTQIEVLASYSSNPVEGQVWYNSTSNVLKGQAATSAGAWATGGGLNTNRTDMATSVAAPPTSVVIAGGGDTSPPTAGTDAEVYNGSSWTEVNNLNTPRYSLTGAGSSSTATIAFGGYGPPGGGNVVTGATESYNGTKWTDLNDMNTGRQSQGNAGTSTSGLAFGGVTDTATVANTESWNGTNWTEVNDLNTARNGARGLGVTNTAALMQGSGVIPTGGLTEQWNGTNWTEVADLSVPRRNQSGAGNYTSALVFGGETPSAADVANTEIWNGTSWAETTDLNTASRNAGNTGTSSGTGTSSPSALSIGGNPIASSGTEEWTGPGAGVTRTFTDS